MPDKRTGNPLADIPYLVSLVTEEQLERWHQKGECLCGCGQVTRINRDGWHSYFTHGHNKRVVDPSHFYTSVQRQRLSQATRAGIERNCVNSLILCDLVRDYCEKNNVTITDLAKKVGCNRSWLADVVNRTKKKTIRRQSAVRILKAIGEPVPPSLYTRAPHTATVIGRKMIPK
jgi:hypothetical protein